MFSICKKATLCVALFAIFLLAGCGGGSSSTSPNLKIALSVVNSAPQAACPNGGITIQSGIDSNDDQVLNEAEVTSEQFICNGSLGAVGVDGLSSLLAINEEPIGVNCPAGGSQVIAGLDVNQNNRLDTLEITSVRYVCHGVSSATAINGIDGIAGTNGTNGTAGAVGATGSAGATGSIGATGTAGTNGTNGTVGAVGATGSTGANGSIGATGTAGANGTNGTAGAVGATGSTGATGSIGATGTAGLVSLVSITSESSGANCAYAGIKVSSGIDTNSDGSLVFSEIQSTKYVCNGAPASTAFAYIYNFTEQVVDKEAAIVFDSTGSISGISHENGSAEIGIRSLGIYLITYSVSGTEPNQFALFVNGRVLEQSVYGSGAGTQQNDGQIIVELNERDSITLVNVSGDKAVTLASKIGGDKLNVNASITILKLNP